MRIRILIVGLICVTIVWTELHNDTHQFSAGEVDINTAFSGNIIAIECDVKPEYQTTHQVIGYLYQYSGVAAKGYAIFSGKDVVSLDLTETDKLVFVPTQYLSDSYDLVLNYAQVEGVVEGQNTVPLPDAIVGLPSRVATLEAFETSAQTQLDTSASAVTELQREVATLTTASNPTWGSIADKPASFPSSEGEVTGLSDSLGALTTGISTNASNITNLTTRTAELESEVSTLTSEQSTLLTSVSSLTAAVSGLSGSGSGVSISSHETASLAQNGTISLTAKEILRIYEKVSLTGANLIAPMTANNAPTPQVASGNDLAAGQYYQAFDTNFAESGAWGNAQSGNYIVLDMGREITADTVSFYVSTALKSGSNYARDLGVYASNDGSTWDSPVFSIAGRNPTADTWDNYPLLATTAARYWKFTYDIAPGAYPSLNKVALSLSSGFAYNDESANYSISKNGNTLSSDTFTIKKNSSGVADVVVTYL